MDKVQSRAEDVSLVELAERLGRSSRHGYTLLLLGMLAVVIGLAVLTVQLNRSLTAAEATRDSEKALRLATEGKFNATNATLEEAKTALAANDRVKLARLLNVALDQTEKGADAAVAGSTGAQMAGSAAPAKPIVVPVPSAGNFPQRVYIQFAGLIDRRDIVSLNRALHKAGWTVEGADGERTEKAAGLNEVRYSAEADRDAAQALATALNESGLNLRTVKPRQVSIIGPGTLEVWISRT